ncbi:MAG: PIN domain-containing protein [Alphaproteobacteria bacterium]|nr:PIN domain-containing protein [Alphaproteobacteria bacterium]
MSADTFFDSNVLLYILSADQVRASHSFALASGGGVISVQVLSEFANVAKKKFGMHIPEIKELLSTLRRFLVVRELNLATHERGLDIAERYRFSIYDSMLLASALEARCRTFYSEDLHHGQRIEGLTIRNPFR